MKGKGGERSWAEGEERGRGSEREEKRTGASQEIRRGYEEILM
jgi:hypothetical protein